ncbi:MAG: hypothetical protein PHV16_01060 [Candidatus Nanoarchaeia archaeon]|nr:hypothetical protein [Candidatus Nanoarchaeia archaeon]
MDNYISDKVKKNLLDLNYNKYLQYFNTSIILLFTYIIALMVGFITRQINYNNLGQMIMVAVVSIIVISVLLLLMQKFRGHQRMIFNEIRKLRI